MTQFKIGDRIRADETTDFYTEGDTGTIQKVELGGDLWVKFDEDNYHSDVKGWNDRYWCVCPKKSTLIDPAVVIFQETYHGEDIIDLPENVGEMLDPNYNVRASLVQTDEYGLAAGSFEVTVIFRPHPKEET